MNFQNIDLEEEFVKLNQKKVAKNSILELKELLDHAYVEDLAIQDRIFSPPITQEIYWEKLDSKRVFTHEQVRSICLKYRLRFLDASIFKGEIPAEAIAKVKQLEKGMDTELQDFKIVAPKSMFRLEDKDSDPILFLKLSENYYYMVHKWGGDLNRFRRILAFPLQTFIHLFWVLIGFSLIAAAIIPTPHFGYTLFMFVHAFIALIGLSCIYIFGNRQNFSSIEWDSKYIA